ncbi:hypothetical protein HDV00_001388, partial [Rhizophlyctis rosea]
MVVGERRRERGEGGGGGLGGLVSGSGSGAVGGSAGGGGGSGRYGTVIFVRDVRGLVPVEEGLGRAYTLSGDDPVAICVANSRAAKEAGRADLAKIWGLAGLILTQCIDSSPLTQSPSFAPAGRGRRSGRGRRRGRRGDVEVGRDGRICMRSVGEEKEREREKEGKRERVAWQWHPFGRRMVHSIFQYLQRAGDIQTLALLSCVLSEPFPPKRVEGSKTFSSASSMDRFLSANAEYFEHIAPSLGHNSAFFTPPLTNMPQGITVITPNMSEAFSRVGVAVGSVVPISTSATTSMGRGGVARGVSAPPEIPHKVDTSSGRVYGAYGSSSQSASGGLQTPQVATSFGSDSALAGYMEEQEGRRRLPMVRG